MVSNVAQRRETERETERERKRERKRERQRERKKERQRERGDMRGLVAFVTHVSLRLLANKKHAHSVI